MFSLKSYAYYICAGSLRQGTLISHLTNFMNILMRSVSTFDLLSNIFRNVYQKTNDYKIHVTERLCRLVSVPLSYPFTFLTLSGESAEVGWCPPWLSTWLAE